LLATNRDYHGTDALVDALQSLKELLFFVEGS